MTPAELATPGPIQDEFLAAIHLVPEDDRAAPIAPNMIPRPTRVDMTSERATESGSSLAIARTWAVDLLEHCSSDLVCTHGDYSMRNLLLETSPRLTISGLIDFERCEYADPAADLVRMLVACPDWNDPALLAFLGAYASAVLLPSRERVLLQLAAIVLDASTWAEQQDPSYYRLLLDLVDRIAADPDCLPSMFPRTATLGG